MKVIKNLTIALVLAVPISPISLVTADELVIKATYNLAIEDYSPDMQEALKLAPVEFKEVVAVPEAVKTDFPVGAARRPAKGDVAYRTVVQ